eukprot:m51a1_g5331 hypothetical protein (373) ;mRNA; f:390172-391687
MRNIATLLALCATAAVALAPYEVPFSGFPAYGVPSGPAGAAFASYHERATLAWYNVVRTAQKKYSNDFIAPLIKCTSLPPLSTAHLRNGLLGRRNGHPTRLAPGTAGDTSAAQVFDGATMPAARPIAWNLNLNRAARAHSADLVASCFKNGAHNDCNGTSMGARIQRFYTPMGMYGEIYAPLGFSGFDAMHWPAWSVAAWVCDGWSGMSWSSSSGYVYTLNGCVTDGSAGHRQNIMKIGGEVGCGVVISGQSLASTCDMSSTASPYPAAQMQVASGAHVTDYANRGMFYFVASWASTAAPTSDPVVVVDGARVPLTLYAGSGGSATYMSAKTAYGSSDACKSYYFLFGSARYPATGSFKTYGIGSCTVDYAA